MYSDRRRCPFEDKRAFEEALIEIANSFSKEWLTSNSGHPLQTLWQRNDLFASIELAYLGISIQKIRDTSPDQLNQRIKTIKEDDLGNMAGAVWEIILAAAFHKPLKQNSRLLGQRQQTYDIEVITESGFKHLISAKNSWRSEKDREFITQFESIEKLIEDNTIFHFQITIFRQANYPSPQEWASLKRNLLKLIKTKVALYSNYSFDGWTIIIRPFTDDQIKDHVKNDRAKLYANAASYTFQMALPFYRNEYRNIKSRLEKACADLINKGTKESNESQNLLYIHLPEYVCFRDYFDWINSFFADNPTAPISYISIIQPAFVTDLDKDNSTLAICYARIDNPNRHNSTVNLYTEFPFGVSANEIKHVTYEGLELPKYHYRMQSGRIHVDFGDTTKCGKMIIRFDHGIITDAIGELNGEKFPLSANFPPTVRLTLL